MTIERFCLSSCLSSRIRRVPPPMNTLAKIFIANFTQERERERESQAEDAGDGRGPRSMIGLREGGEGDGTVTVGTHVTTSKFIPTNRRHWKSISWE